MTAFLLIFTVLVIFPNSLGKWRVWMTSLGLKIDTEIGFSPILAFSGLRSVCEASGICGGYDGCPPAPPPSSCSYPGFLWMWTFWMLSNGSKRIKAFRATARVASQGKVNPNRAFMECCMDRETSRCLSPKGCSFNSYNKDALTKMYFKQDAHPLAAMSEGPILRRNGQGRDHTECCARNGVTTTLAGSKCLLFCDQKPGRVTPLDLTYVPCFDRFASMKACFWHELSTFYKIR
ncbi:unnamed protein product, partial [Mesorhabditis belari]|uniref:Domain of unknown function DB domain-containing protein n=1 Tax=Mesorhabditis belari TaxID=2138241 RepID=A0AAF3FSF2_9BILA